MFFFFFFGFFVIYLRFDLAVFWGEKEDVRSRMRMAVDDETPKFVIPPPFPERFAQPKKENKLETAPEDIQDPYHVIPKVTSQEKQVAAIEEENGVLTEEEILAVDDFEIVFVADFTNGHPSGVSYEHFADSPNPYVPKLFAPTNHEG
ncbi:hypothetical protein L6452_18849 [Arctium lappa]|uniref:Uncharacterized protein n=1 Tax=Arctium lappa TaxID=4217 RepID=A0ACB9C774_ARCLA|nr:hypothetical protein L6452_18849 [Arctium lappa]